MLVSRENLPQVIESLARCQVFGLDTETTGLNAYQGDRLFSLILSTVTQDYYFNFQAYPGLEDIWVLSKDALDQLKPIFDKPDNVYFIANAKFDMAMLYQEGLELAGKVVDTELTGRLIYNQHMRYGLDARVKRALGEAKDTTVEEWIKTNKATSWDGFLDNPKKSKLVHYDKVPFDIMSRYGQKDGKLVRQLGLHDQEELGKIAQVSTKDFTRVCENDYKLTKTAFKMERLGILVDREYCQRAYHHEREEAQRAAKRFEEISGLAFKDSRKTLSQAFDAAGFSYPTTEKGNPSFTDKVLTSFDSPLADALKQYRKASKKANTYYANFLYYADGRDAIHANIKLAGTDTGRFSYSEPNLQNLSKEEDTSQPFLIRRAFKPRPGFIFVMIDYDQMEYRMMLDYAEQLDVITKVLDGLDVHTATGELMGVERVKAKTLNFLLLYGGGNGKLADALGISFDKAKALRQHYFSSLPKVRSFIRRVTNKAEREGMIFNWAGRRYHFPNRDFAYKAPNHLIQGGCSEVVRFAMNSLDDYLATLRSRMLVQVHDEILFEVHRSELEIIPQLVHIMQTAYPHKRLPLTCGVDYSEKSWADKKPFNINDLKV